MIAGDAHLSVLDRDGLGGLGHRRGGQGRFGLGEFDGEPIPILAAETVTPTQPPDQPYGGILELQ
jgi:hypothetical protein